MTSAMALTLEQVLVLEVPSSGEPTSVKVRVVRLDPKQVVFELLDAAAAQSPGLAVGQQLQARLFDGVALLTAKLQVLHLEPASPPQVTTTRPATFERVQRRAFYRVDVQLPLLYRQVPPPPPPQGPAAPEQPWLSGTTSDLSGGGLAFRAEVRYRRGEVLELQLSLPEVGRLSAAGRIVRASEMAAIGRLPPGYVYGVEFQGLLPADQNRIVSYVFRLQQARRRG